MDIMVEGDTEELKAGTEKFLSLKRLVSILEQYLSKVNRNDPLNLDPVTGGEMAAEMVSRWKLAVNTAENIHKMKVRFHLHLAITVTVTSLLIR